MDAICKAGLKVELRFPNGITAIKMNKDRLKLFSRAGVKQLFFGLESTSETIRSDLKKGFAKYDDILELTRFARSLCIQADISLITGFPHQTPTEMAGDFSRLFKDGVISTPPNPYYPIVGTELFNETKKQGGLNENSLSWYEPLNFPVTGERFNRLHVSSSYLLGMSLSHSRLRKFHQKFILPQGRPEPRKILDALRYVGVNFISEFRLDDFFVSFNLLLFFEINGYRLDRFIYRNVEKLEAVKSQLEILAAEVIKVTLEVWTHTSYEIVQVYAEKTEIISGSRFQFRQIDKPLNEVISLFLENSGRISEKK
uniref:Radical SAM superfamily protein n=1 Tax=Candidatus Kentrum sp. LPFa TaxID=2126335 RepID=A0A450W1N2_9GAMM|nr:MAG: hypothetical protein BECKLPF1236B_GA0070989_101720 [Candidatus Kentron sp. LPFa]